MKPGFGPHTDMGRWDGFRKLSGLWLVVSPIAAVAAAARDAVIGGRFGCGGRRVGPLPGKTSFNNYQFGSHRQTPIFTIMIVIISLSRRWRSTREGKVSEWIGLLLKHSIIHCGCRGAFRNKSKSTATFPLQRHIRLCSILFSECRRMKRVEGRWVELEMKIVFAPVVRPSSDDGAKAAAAAAK